MKYRFKPTEQFWKSFYQKWSVGLKRYFIYAAAVASLRSGVNEIPLQADRTVLVKAFPELFGRLEADRTVLEKLLPELFGRLEAVFHLRRCGAKPPQRRK